MKVLMISGDRRVLEERSDAYKRLELQRSQVDTLDVFVWPHPHSWRHILKAARTNIYDVVTVQDPFWRGLLGLTIARLADAKLQVQVHTDLSAQSFFRHILAQIVLRHADSVRVVSEKIRGQVIVMGVKAPIHVLPVYVDLERFRGLKRELQENKKTILWIGRFEDEKDPASALQILHKVRRGGIDARLIMLGSGSLELKLKTLAAGLPVEFPGWQPSSAYLPMADVVICTSKHESWGASMVEALAAGVPVVAPDVGIAKEAGAIITTRLNIVGAVVEVLRSPRWGELRLPMLTAEEWAKKWRETLI